MNEQTDVSVGMELVVADTYESILSEAESVVPVDYLHSLKDLDIRVDGVGKRVELLNVSKSIELSTVLKFDDYSFRQFIKRLHPKSDEEFLDALSWELETNVLEDLLKEKIEKSRKENPKFLFRTYRNSNRIFACLTDGYVPVNHNQLVKGFLNVVDKIKAVGIEQDRGVHKMFQSLINYRTAVVRMPIHKISSDNEGVFTGLEFANAQDGSHRLTIRLMLFELICTNGMIGTTAEFVYLDRAHRGKFKGFDAKDLLEWYDEQRVLMESVYVSLIGVIVKDPFELIEKLPKRYPIITEEMCLVIDSALKKQACVRGNECSAFNIVSAITKASQEFKDERRFQLDNFAYKLAKKEWL